MTCLGEVGVINEQQLRLCSISFPQLPKTEQLFCVADLYLHCFRKTWLHTFAKSRLNCHWRLGFTDPMSLSLLEQRD